MAKKKLAFVLGIRPDLIRAALIIKHLREKQDLEFVFIWSGQHYSDNLKGIFFKELGLEPAQIDLGCGGETDAEVSSQVITKLYKALNELKPMAVVFLGDTNTTTGCVAAAQLNVPIVHIEGCMRSYDWRMPEEKCRTMIDHLSDVIYTYFDEYKEQGIREGINPESIVVVTNPIVDILNEFYYSKIKKFEEMANEKFFSSRGLKKNEFYFMTCHRRENVHNPESLKAIFNLTAQAKYPVYFSASYRTQKVIKEMQLTLPKNVIMVDPIGYEETLCLIVNSRGVITDSGTIVEETCVLQVPSIQMRKSTERPQVYDAKSSVKFDPALANQYPADVVLKKFENLYGKKWDHKLGDGKASQRIADDLYRRAMEDGFARHRPEQYHLPIKRSYSEDGL